jgi:carboxyl-terminal processing protease
MIHPAILLLLFTVVQVLAAAPARAEPFGAQRGFDQNLVADVMSTAFGFMAPRTLDAVPFQDLTMWALRGLTTLDPRLQPELRDGTLRLVAPGRVLLARAPPAPDDAQGWGEAAAQMARAGWDASEAVRAVGTQGVLQTLFDELFNHLDPYSRYTDPDAAAADRARRDGEGGVGIALQLAAHGGWPVLGSVVRDGPAARAGLRAGTRLLAIDGEPTKGVDLPTLAAMLAGPEGTAVTLRLRLRDGRVQDVTLARALILPRTVTAERDGDLLVLHVSSFSSDTAARLADALVGGLAGPHRPLGVVLDLRGNRGGLLREAVVAAETLLAHGLVAATAGRDPAAAHSFVADGSDLSGGLPVVVLVDGRSASAAEVLAAALADQRRGVVVGSATLGKGLVQTIAPLPDGGELYITWSRVLAPFGWPIQGLGVLPQVCTSMGEDALRRQMAALAHGQQPMARALARHRAARAPVSPAEMLDIRSACPAAEGRDLDLYAANRLVHDPIAYDAALIGPPPPPQLARSQDLTAAPAMRN